MVIRALLLALAALAWTGIAAEPAVSQDASLAGYDLNRHVHALAEVNIWRFREGGSGGVFARSVNAVLVLRL